MAGLPRLKRLYQVVLLIVILLTIYTLVPSVPAKAQTNQRPFTLPFNTMAGPSTWMQGQLYGNTTGAARRGRDWYAAGQGLHFGIDISAPCGTAVVAIADGIVQYVDNLGFGAAPHNVILSHPDLGYTSLYGHLLAKSPITRGAAVKRGDVIGQTGDPDLTCVSRPHLHLEIRSMDYRTAYNPIALIDADWDMLVMIGNPGSGKFAKDLDNPNRWQTLTDQPDVKFGGYPLNNFNTSWPLAQRVAPPSETLPEFTAQPVSETASIEGITLPGCCSQAWWSPGGSGLRFWDGPEGQRAIIRVMSMDRNQPDTEETGTYKLLSPNGMYEVQWDYFRGSLMLRGIVEGHEWAIPSSGAWPRFSPSSQQILWQNQSGESIPGSPPPANVIWVMKVDGTGQTRVATLRGGSVSWLDDNRLLLSQRIQNSNESNLSILDLTTKATVPLLTAANLRGVSIAPGGEHIAYYLNFQEQTDRNGMYLLETKEGATPQKLPFFGSWRWRDSNSILYVPFRPGEPMALKLYDITSESETEIKLPTDPVFRVANDDWSVSPDGRYVHYWSAVDYGIKVIDLVE